MTCRARRENGVGRSGEGMMPAVLKHIVFKPFGIGAQPRQKAVYAMAAAEKL